jgi:hypothetical protein
MFGIYLNFLENINIYTCYYNIGKMYIFNPGFLIYIRVNSLVGGKMEIYPTMKNYPTLLDEMWEIKNSEEIMFGLNLPLGDLTTDGLDGLADRTKLPALKRTLDYLTKLAGRDGSWKQYSDYPDCGLYPWDV